MTNQPKHNPIHAWILWKKRPKASNWINANVNQWLQESNRRKSDLKEPLIATCVCFSRQIGSGALEVADALSVRIISSKEYRVKRIAKLLNIPCADAEKELNCFDKEQTEFFKSMFNQKQMEEHQFDLIINREYMEDAADIAHIVACTFEYKFGIQL